MEKHTRDELASAIYGKEQELMDKEESYYRAQRLLETRLDTLSDRRFRLIQLIDQEQERMSYILRHYNADKQEAEEFYRASQQLLDEAEWTYRDSVQAVELEYEESQQVLRSEREQLEMELYELRRDYHDADE